jgi:SAM-dependent methyltransferase
MAFMVKLGDCFPGFCPVCENQVTFIIASERSKPQISEGAWLRSALRCSNCNSPPRERALAHVLKSLIPDWRSASLHESSPGQWLSRRLQSECSGYVATQYDPTFPFGQVNLSGEWRNENLEAQTFEDEIFDIVVTQDVFEHLFQPGVAAKEIARTLKPGGYAIISVPVVRHWQQSRRRASLQDGQVIHHYPEDYHGNPVGDGRALVTIDWGYDIGAYLSACSGMSFATLILDDMTIGVRDIFNTIIVGKKGYLPVL